MREFEKGKILHHIVYLTWPMILANVFQNFVSLFEVYLLGRLGVAELAAFAIGTTILMIFWSFGGGMLSGSIAMIARLNGEKNYKRMNRSIVQMLFANLIMAAAFIILTFIFLEPMLKFFGAKGETLMHAKKYVKYLFLALPFVGITFTTIVSLRATGDSITPLKIVIGMVIANGIAAPVFILGLGPVPLFGIAGAALGTVANFVVGATISLILMFKGINNIKIQPHYISPDFEIMGRFMKLAVPAMGQGLIPNVANVLLIRMMATYGDAYIAAFGIFGKLMTILMMFGWPIGNSGGILVGYHLGKKIMNRVDETVRTGVLTYTWFTAGFFLIYFIFSQQIMGLLSKDPEVIKYGVAFLKIVTPALVVMGFALVVHAAFNGAGSTHLPTIINFVAFIVVQIMLAYYLPKFNVFGSNGIPIAILAAYLVQGTMTVLIYRQKKWIKHEIC